MISFDAAVAQQQTTAADAVADFTRAAVASLSALKSQHEQQLAQLEAWVAATRDARASGQKQHEQVCSSLLTFGVLS